MGRAEASVASQFSRAVLTIAHRLPNAKVIDFASFLTIYRGVWNMLRYCSDCTFLRSFSGHGPVMVAFSTQQSNHVVHPLGRLRLPASLPFSDCQVKAVVQVLFLSVHLYGTIIAYPYIYTEQLLLTKPEKG